jgi:glycosyltransferase involved in cell wall biosynthesis
MSGTRPLCTFVIPTHDRGRYVVEAVESALAQSVPADVIVIDDGSTDGTRERLAARFGARVRCESQSRRGSASARNAGVRLAATPYVAFLDSDDRASPDRVERQLRVLEAEAPAVLAYSNIRWMDARGHPLAIRRGRRRYRSGPVLQAIVVRNFVPFSTVMARREALVHVGLFDESLSYAEDWHLLCRLAEVGPFAYIDAPLTDYRVHATSKTASLEAKAHAVRTVHARVFSDVHVGPHQATLARRSAASVDLSLASLALQLGQPLTFLRYAGRALRSDPLTPVRNRHEIVGRLCAGLWRTRVD